MNYGIAEPAGILERVSATTIRVAIVPRALIILPELGQHAPEAQTLRAAVCKAVAQLCAEPTAKVAAVVGTEQYQGHSSHHTAAAATDGSLAPWGGRGCVGRGSSVAEIIAAWALSAGVPAPVQPPLWEYFPTIAAAESQGYRRFLVVVDGPFGLTSDSPLGLLAGATELDALCGSIVAETTDGVSSQQCAKVKAANFAAFHPESDCSDLWLELARLSANLSASGPAGVEKRRLYGDAPFGVGYHVAAWRALAPAGSSHSLIVEE